VTPLCRAEGPKSQVPTNPRRENVRRMFVSQSCILGDGVSRRLRELREQMFRRGRGRVRQPGPSRGRTEVGRGEIRTLEPAESAGLEETVTRVQNVRRPFEGE